MKKKLLLPLFFLFVLNDFFAQQDVQFSHYAFNKLSFNPAYAGIRKAYCYSGLFREQWTGFPGNPRNVLFSGDAYISALSGGIGLTFLNDQLGFDKTNVVKLSYAFHRPLGIGILSLGVEGGIIQKSLGGPWVYNDQNDPSIPVNGVKNTIWDIGLGIYYEVEGGLYFGLSTLHIPQNDFFFKPGSVKFYESVLHHYLTAGWEFFLPNVDVNIKPSILVKTDAASTQIDFNLLALWQRAIWIGASYRLTDAAVVMVGVQREMGRNYFKAGYSYDITASSLKQYSSGSHEIFVSYCIPIKEKTRRTTWSNPRYLWD